jgi:hypothetical protein
VTNFTTSIDVADSVSIDGALDTIKEHHPHQCVWVEH